MVPLPNGRRAAAAQLEAGWARATAACLHAASEGESSRLYPFFTPVRAVIWGLSQGQWQPAASLAHGSAPCGVGSTPVLEEQETSTGPGAGRAETPQETENGFSGAVKARKGTWVEITGLGGAGAGGPRP